ncbi:cytochrome P450 10, partial [Aplysia californica]|uniref:Cholesterol side-chain cleavage enzyme, mitochondrial n=1 Tax=Aplysia californica TaxID=6500 RepID=A0ABM1VTE1_APLCA
YLIRSQGEEWYKQRTVVSKKMLKLGEVSNFSTEMGEVSDDFVSRLGKIRDVNGEVPKLERELFKWAMESIGTFIFEERIGCLGDQPSSMAQSFIENMEGFFKTLQPLLYNLPFYKLWKTQLWQEFESYSDNIMEIGHHMVEKVRLYWVFAVIIYTSTATTWCLYLLAKHPEVQERLLSEINAAADKNGDVAADVLCRLPLVKGVVKETLRMYPITYSTSRNMTEDTEIGGYNVPAGTHVQANLYGMYHDPALFPEPESFRPERWLRENSGDMDPTVKAMSNLVWGHGARMCIGRRVAEQEMHITLSKIVQKFKLSYEHDDVEPVLNTMMTPDRPLRVKLTPRF